MNNESQQQLPPSFKREMIDAKIPVGTSTKFQVEVIGSPELLKVYWNHNGKTVNNSDRHILLQDRGIYCIQIHETNPKDEGKWVCRVENKYGNATCYATLQLLIPEDYSPPEFLTGLRGFLWDNGTISLECDVIGVPTPVLRWYRNGKTLDPGSSISIRTYSKETKAFLGLFACEAQNCMGTKAAFSRVYARDFAIYLRQIGQFNRVEGSTVIKQVKPEKKEAKEKHGENKAKKKTNKKVRDDDEDSGIDHV